MAHNLDTSQRGAISDDDTLLHQLLRSMGLHDTATALSCELGKLYGGSSHASVSALHHNSNSNSGIKPASEDSAKGMTSSTGLGKDYAGTREGIQAATIEQKQKQQQQQHSIEAITRHLSEQKQNRLKHCADALAQCTVALVTQSSSRSVSNTSGAYISAEQEVMDALRGVVDCVYELSVGTVTDTTNEGEIINSHRYFPYHSSPPKEEEYDDDNDGQAVRAVVSLFLGYCRVLWLQLELSECVLRCDTLTWQHSTSLKAAEVLVAQGNNDYDEEEGEEKIIVGKKKTTKRQKRSRPLGTPTTSSSNSSLRNCRNNGKGEIHHDAFSNPLRDGGGGVYSAPMLKEARSAVLHCATRLQSCLSELRREALAVVANTEEEEDSGSTWIASADASPCGEHLPYRLLTARIASSLAVTSGAWTSKMECVLRWVLQQYSSSDIEGWYVASTVQESNGTATAATATAVHMSSSALPRSSLLLDDMFSEVAAAVGAGTCTSTNFLSTSSVMAGEEVSKAVQRSIHSNLRGAYLSIVHCTCRAQAVLWMLDSLKELVLLLPPPPSSSCAVDGDTSRPSSPVTTTPRMQTMSIAVGKLVLVQGKWLTRCADDLEEYPAEKLHTHGREEQEEGKEETSATQNRDQRESGDGGGLVAAQEEALASKVAVLAGQFRGGVCQLWLSAAPIEDFNRAHESVNEEHRGEGATLREEAQGDERPLPIWQLSSMTATVSDSAFVAAAASASAHRTLAEALVLQKGTPCGWSSTLGGRSVPSSLRHMPARQVDEGPAMPHTYPADGEAALYSNFFPLQNAMATAIGSPLSSSPSSSVPVIKPAQYKQMLQALSTGTAPAALLASIKSNSSYHGGDCAGGSGSLQRRDWESARVVRQQHQRHLLRRALSNHRVLLESVHPASGLPVVLQLRAMQSALVTVQRARLERFQAQQLSASGGDVKPRGDVVPILSNVKEHSTAPLPSTAGGGTGASGASFSECAATTPTAATTAEAAAAVAVAAMAAVTATCASPTASSTAASHTMPHAETLASMGGPQRQARASTASATLRQTSVPASPADAATARRRRAGRESSQSPASAPVPRPRPRTPSRWQRRTSSVIRRMARDLSAIVERVIATSDATMQHMEGGTATSELSETEDTTTATATRTAGAEEEEEEDDHDSIASSADDFFQRVADEVTEEVQHVTVTPCGTLLAFVTARGRIVVFALKASPNSLDAREELLLDTVLDGMPEHPHWYEATSALVHFSPDARSVLASVQYAPTAVPQREEGELSVVPACTGKVSIYSLHRDNSAGGSAGGGGRGAAAAAGQVSGDGGADTGVFAPPPIALSVASRQSSITGVSPKGSGNNTLPAAASGAAVPSAGTTEAALEQMLRTPDRLYATFKVSEKPLVQTRWVDPRFWGGGWSTCLGDASDHAAAVQDFCTRQIHKTTTQPGGDRVATTGTATTNIFIDVETCAWRLALQSRLHSYQCLSSTYDNIIVRWLPASGVVVQRIHTPSLQDLIVSPLMEAIYTICDDGQLAMYDAWNELDIPGESMSSNAAAITTPSANSLAAAGPQSPPRYTIVCERGLPASMTLLRSAAETHRRQQEPRADPELPTAYFAGTRIVQFDRSAVLVPVRSELVVTRSGSSAVADASVQDNEEGAIISAVGRSAQDASGGAARPVRRYSRAAAATNAAVAAFSRFFRGHHHNHHSSSGSSTQQQQAQNRRYTLHRGEGRGERGTDEVNRPTAIAADEVARTGRKLIEEVLSLKVSDPLALHAQLDPTTSDDEEERQRRHLRTAAGYAATATTTTRLGNDEEEDAETRSPLDHLSVAYTAEDAFNITSTGSTGSHPLHTKPHSATARIPRIRYQSGTCLLFSAVPWALTHTGGLHHTRSADLNMGPSGPAYRLLSMAVSGEPQWKDEASTTALAREEKQHTRWVRRVARACREAGTSLSSFGITECEREREGESVKEIKKKKRGIILKSSSKSKRSKNKEQQNPAEPRVSFSEAAVAESAAMLEARAFAITYHSEAIPVSNIGSAAAAAQRHVRALADDEDAAAWNGMALAPTAKNGRYLFIMASVGPFRSFMDSTKPLEFKPGFYACLVFDVLLSHVLRVIPVCPVKPNLENTLNGVIPTHGNTHKAPLYLLQCSAAVIDGPAQQADEEQQQQQQHGDEEIAAAAPFPFPEGSEAAAAAANVSTLGVETILLTVGGLNETVHVFDAMSGDRLRTVRLQRSLACPTPNEETVKTTAVSPAPGIGVRNSCLSSTQVFQDSLECGAAGGLDPLFDLATAAEIQRQRVMQRILTDGLDDGTLKSADDADGDGDDSASTRSSDSVMSLHKGEGETEDEEERIKGGCSSISRKGEKMNKEAAQGKKRMVHQDPLPRCRQSPQVALAKHSLPRQLVKKRQRWQQQRLYTLDALVNLFGPTAVVRGQIDLLGIVPFLAKAQASCGGGRRPSSGLFLSFVLPNRGYTFDTRAGAYRAAAAASSTSCHFAADGSTTTTYLGGEDSLCTWYPYQQQQQQQQLHEPFQLAAQQREAIQSALASLVLRHVEERTAESGEAAANVMGQDASRQSAASTVAALFAPPAGHASHARSGPDTLPYHHQQQFRCGVVNSVASFYDAVHGGCYVFASTEHGRLCMIGGPLMEAVENEEDVIPGMWM